MINALQELLRIRSVAGAPEGPYPYGSGPAAALDHVLSLCRAFGFRTKNADYRYGYAEIGQGSEMIAILVHLDTVPEGSGWTHPPFDGTIVENRLYGRGVEDDKGPAIACIYAMKDLLEQGVPLQKRIRLIFGQDEETGDWLDIKAYCESEELPAYGFTPDGSFPAIYGEKGILVVGMAMPLAESGLTAAEGGSAPNMVPDRCSAVYGGRTYTAVGRSAHGSLPHEGVNAITRLMAQLSRLPQPPRFARCYTDLMGDSLCGERMGIDFQDRQSGRLSLNAGQLIVEDGELRVYCDIRYPVTVSGREVLARMEKAAAAYGIRVWKRYEMAPVYMDQQGAVMTCLLEAYRSVTGDISEPLVVGGGTYARAMKNIVAFGPALPEKPSTEHQADENMDVDDLLRLRDIYRTALSKLLQL